MYILSPFALSLSKGSWFDRLTTNGEQTEMEVS